MQDLGNPMGKKRQDEAQNDRANKKDGDQLITCFFAHSSKSWGKMRKLSSVYPLPNNQGEAITRTAEDPQISDVAPTVATAGTR